MKTKTETDSSFVGFFSSSFLAKLHLRFPTFKLINAHQTKVSVFPREL